jgi:glycerol-3-phosphate dehydrogenase
VREPPITRVAALAAAESTRFEVAVLGAGINGAAVAHECARHGLSVLLLDKGDLASGTSSRSSRLIHGGIRYLEYAQLALVFESSRERRALRALAPHLVRPLRFLWPLYEGARIPRWKLRLGMTLYDALSLYRNFARHRFLSSTEALGEEPLLSSRGLRGGAAYYDAATDDARLALLNAMAAQSNGAVVLTWCATERLRADDGGVRLALRDRIGGAQLEATARVVVNAAGPWSDEVGRMLHPSHTPRVRASAGAHIAVERHRLGNAGALTLTSPLDGRVFFVLPDGPLAVIGTTERETRAHPDTVRATVADVDYLLSSANHYFPAAKLAHGDTISCWAGIRPLAARFFRGDSGRTSREHELRWTSGAMLSVTGGKLTTYRVVARQVLRLVLGRLDRTSAKETASEQLPGGDASAFATEEELANAVRDGLAPDCARHLADVYGSEWRSVLQIAEKEPDLGRRLHPEWPQVRAEVVFAARYEMAATPADVIVRRTRLAFGLRDHGASVVEDVCTLMQRELGWSDSERRAMAALFGGEVQRMFGIDADERSL